MKRLVGLFCCCLVLSNTCFAYTSCKGGTIIKGANGVEFCKSNNVMSWYAAHAWCYANGGQLATKANLCPTITNNICNNMKNSVDYIAWGFINLRSGNNGFYRVHLRDGTYGASQKLNRSVRGADGETTDFGGITDMHALCEQTL